MKGKLEKEGKYELFETNHGNEILNLNDKDFYAIVNGQKGQILVKSNADHEKKKTIQKGQFYLADFEDDPEFRDMPHLFLKDGSKYSELILPNDVPTKGDHQKKLITTKTKVGEAKVKEHVKGKGNTGSEKTTKPKESKNAEPDDLENLSKQELYDKAKEKNIPNRSKMNKKQLVNELKK